MICGLCGGGIRGYAGVLHGRPIKDWKHTSVPPGTVPHRPVLGTPVDAETLDRVHRAPKEEVAPKRGSVPPAVPLRLAKVSEVPGAALKLAELASDYGWKVEPTSYCQTAAGKSWVIVRARRADLGAIGVWENGGFEDGYQVVHGHAERVGSEQIKVWLKQPDLRCTDCGCADIAHNDEGECP